MSRELDFDGYWEGDAVYTCDCCKKAKEKFRFGCEADVDSRKHRAELRKKGWVMCKVNDQWHDFCSEDCRNEYIRKNTI